MPTLDAGGSVDVLICGAGPNGLMLAGELALAGVRPLVLDGLPEPSHEPRANSVVGQVVRFLDMRGLYADLAGVPGPPEARSGLHLQRASEPSPSAGTTPPPHSS